MRNTVGLVLAAALSALPLFSQTPVEGGKVFDDLSERRGKEIRESRRLAQQELAPQSGRFASPDIAIALDFSAYLISIARITAVQLPAGDSAPRTRISFHVEQMLRGASDVADFVVESRWTPNRPAEEESSLGAIQVGNFRGTVLDKSEPKEGDRYILGYSLDYGDGKTVFVPSAINIQDPSQGPLISDVYHFLKMESVAAAGYEPFLEALDNAAPWIRDVAVHRLSYSDACNTSPACEKRFLAAVSRQLQSKVPDERMEAIAWLVWIDSVSRSQSVQKRWSDGIPILPDSVIRQFLSAAIDDPNVYIGDEGFERREMFDFQRSGKPGECIQIVPALRKSAHWIGAEHSRAYGLLTADFPFTSTISCLPAQKPQGR